jgi:hypothetical protein
MQYFIEYREKGRTICCEDTYAGVHLVLLMRIHLQVLLSGGGEVQVKSINQSINQENEDFSFRCLNVLLG